jgi:hypothetical protein
MGLQPHENNAKHRGLQARISVGRYEYNCSMNATGVYYRRIPPHQRRFSASNSSSVRGQSDPSNRERLRSASTLPPVWQRAQ